MLDATLTGHSSGVFNYNRAEPDISSEGNGRDAIRNDGQDLTHPM
jgi:hypothetical protein